LAANGDIPAIRFAIAINCHYVEASTAVALFGTRALRAAFNAEIYFSRAAGVSVRFFFKTRLPDPPHIPAAEDLDILSVPSADDRAVLAHAVISANALARERRLIDQR
jgi:hypothetical protein